MDKHELHSDSPEQSAQVEWDSLNEAVPFSKENKETSDEISEFVTDHYGKILDKFIDVCYFDGDDRSNPDHYTISMLLGEYLSTDEQRSIIESCAKGEPIAPEMAQKVLDGITDVIEKAGLIDILKTDPFLRNRRLIELSKGPEWAKGKSREEVDLTHKLWGTDDDFYTGAGISLLYDRNYLDRKCDVSGKVEQYAARFKNENSEQIKEQSLASLSDTMGHLVRTGQVGAKEIIEDPLLRKRHFDSLLDLEINPTKIDPSIASLWRFDTDFEDSIDYSMALSDKINDNPDIYGAVDDAEIEHATDEILEKIPEKRLAEIAHIYEKDPQKGDRLLLETLMPLLGLENNQPTLTYGVIKRKQEKGHYNRFKHEITICEENITDDNPDDESAKRPIFSLFKSKKPRNITYMRMNIIAHEIWHAHQWAGTNVDKDRKSKYQSNFVYYLDGRTGYLGYRNQLIEKEAFRFGEKIETRSRKAIGDSKK